MTINRLPLICGALLLLVGGADAHSGRRLAVVVLNGQLAAHGYNTGASDGQVSPRPYYNAIHGHWNNSPAGPQVATATLPGFDVFGPNSVGVVGVAPSAGLLAGESLTLTLLSAGTWTPPTSPISHGNFGPISIVPLTAVNAVEIEHQGQAYLTSDPGQISFPLALGGEIDPLVGAVDLDLIYRTSGHPTGSLYVLEWALSTTAAGITDSGSVYTLLSPEGMLHHQSLYAESQLSVAVAPTPGASMLALITLYGASMWGGGRRCREGVTNA